MRGEQLVIPYKLQPEVIALAHEGHLGMQATIRNLRERVWWPRMAQQAKEYVATCLPCAAAVSRNDPAPMVSREMPTKPWTHCSADYKGPIGGSYYFHVLIDQYSRYPVVQMTKSTSFDKLYPRLDETFGLFGIPESVTHDGGPPYNSKEWRNYAKEKGFKTDKTTPAHPQSNGLAERFMASIVKVTLTAIAEKLDPKEEVQKFLLNYRATPHPSPANSSWQHTSPAASLQLG